MGDNGNNVSRGHSVRPESDPFDLRAADWHEVLWVFVLCCSPYLRSFANVPKHEKWYL
jgi:hypothetical protein